MGASGSLLSGSEVYGRRWSGAPLEHEPQEVDVRLMRTARILRARNLEHAGWARSGRS